MATTTMGETFARRTYVLFLAIVFAALASAQSELAFTSPELSSGSSYSIGEDVDISWTTPFDDTTLIVYQSVNGDFQFEILALDRSPDQTSFTWTADTVNGVSVSDGGPLYFSIQNSDDIACDGCVARSGFFNLQAEGSGSSATSSAGSSTASSTGAGSGQAGATSTAAEGGSQQTPTSGGAGAQETSGDQSPSAGAAESSNDSSGDEAQATSSSTSNYNRTIGLAVGLGVGIPVLLLLAALIFLFFRRRKKNQEQEKYRRADSGDNDSGENGGDPPPTTQYSNAAPVAAGTAAAAGAGAAAGAAAASTPMEEVDKRESGALGAWANSRNQPSPYDYQPPPPIPPSRQSGVSGRSNPFRPPSAMSHSSWIEPFEFERPQSERKEPEPMGQLREVIPLPDEMDMGDGESSRYSGSRAHSITESLPGSEVPPQEQDQINRQSDMSFTGGVDLSSLEGGAPGLRQPEPYVQQRYGRSQTPDGWPLQ